MEGVGAPSPAQDGKPPKKLDMLYGGKYTK